MTDFIAFLNSIYKISPDLNDHLTSVLKERVVLKKEYLLKAGHVCKTIWFIKKGLVRCFYHRDAVEVCSWFMKEGDFVISVESFFNQKPSIESIQALEETEVYYLDYEELQNTYDAFLNLT
jgi:CRP-like cAMP-binding protein